MPNTINELGNNIIELNRVHNIEVNMPYSGKKSILFRKEKVLLYNNNPLSQSQLEPIIKNYADNANKTVVIYDPILRRDVEISLIGLVDAIQKFGE